MPKPRFRSGLLPRDGQCVSQSFCVINPFLCSYSGTLITQGTVGNSVPEVQPSCSKVGHVWLQSADGFFLAPESCIRPNLSAFSPF